MWDSPDMLTGLEADKLREQQERARQMRQHEARLEQTFRKYFTEGTREELLELLANTEMRCTGEGREYLLEGEGIWVDSGTFFDEVIFPRFGFVYDAKANDQISVYQYVSEKLILEALGRRCVEKATRAPNAGRYIQGRKPVPKRKTRGRTE